MSLKENLLRHKELYYKNKNDIRYLRDAVISLATEYYKDPEYRDCIEWIGDEIISEFEKKCETQQKNEEIGALVAHIVFYGATVDTAIEAIADWLIISKTKVRDGYYKIHKNFDFDPKMKSKTKWNIFRREYGLIPLYFVRVQREKGRQFPGTGTDKENEYWIVWNSMIKAYSEAVKYEEELKEYETEFLLSISNG